MPSKPTLRSDRNRGRPASPILFPRNAPVPTRAEIEAMVEGLIAYLDGLDGDPDTEMEEPDASACEWSGKGAHRFNVGVAA